MALVIKVYAIIVTMIVGGQQVSYVAVSGLADRASCLKLSAAYQAMFDRKGAPATVTCAAHVEWEEVR